MQQVDGVSSAAGRLGWCIGFARDVTQCATAGDPGNTRVDHCANTGVWQQTWARSGHDQGTTHSWGQHYVD